MPFHRPGLFPRKKNDGSIQVYDGEGPTPEELEKAARREVNRANKLFRYIGNWRFVNSGVDGRGRTNRFCYSLHRNDAGYFLAWREIISPIKSEAEGKRLRAEVEEKRQKDPKFQDRVSSEGRHGCYLTRLDVCARRSKKRAKALAERRATVWLKKHSDKKEVPA